MAIFTYSYRKNQLNLVKYAIHGFYGNRRVAVNFLWTKVVELFHGPSIAGDVGVVSWGPQQALRLRRFKHPNMHQNAADWRWMICDAWQLSYIPDCSAYQEFWSYFFLVAFQKSKCRQLPSSSWYDVPFQIWTSRWSARAQSHSKLGICSQVTGNRAWFVEGEANRFLYFFLDFLWWWWWW